MYVQLVLLSAYSVFVSLVDLARERTTQQTVSDGAVALLEKNFTGSLSACSELVRQL